MTKLGLSGGKPPSFPNRIQPPPLRKGQRYGRQRCQAMMQASREATILLAPRIGPAPGSHGGINRSRLLILRYARSGAEQGQKHLRGSGIPTSFEVFSRDGPGGGGMAQGNNARRESQPSRAGDRQGDPGGGLRCPTFDVEEIIRMMQEEEVLELAGLPPSSSDSTAYVFG